MPFEATVGWMPLNGRRAAQLAAVGLPRWTRGRMTMDVLVRALTDRIEASLAEEGVPPEDRTENLIARMEERGLIDEVVWTPGQEPMETVIRCNPMVGNALARLGLIDQMAMLPGRDLLDQIWTLEPSLDEMLDAMVARAGGE